MDSTPSSFVWYFPQKSSKTQTRRSLPGDGVRGQTLPERRGGLCRGGKVHKTPPSQRLGSGLEAQVVLGTGTVSAPKSQAVRPLHPHQPCWASQLASPVAFAISPWN